MSTWPTIERFIVEQGAAVLVTLAECQGSSPREAGARMIVRKDGAFAGTIGGGALEWSALAEAQEMMASDVALRTLDMALGPDLGQCCGGRVLLMLERFDRDDASKVAALAAAEREGPIVTIARTEAGRAVRKLADAQETASSAARYARLSDGRIIERFGAQPTPLYLFGAGHVGRGLALALAPLPFEVTWIDPRPQAFPPHVPANVMCVTDAAPATLISRAPDGAFVAVMTHSHALDLDVVAAALQARRFAYVGLIGSETKRARFVSTLRKMSLTADDIDRLVCPIGLSEIADKSPAAIAASIAAQLLIVRDRVLAVQDQPTVASPPLGAHHG
jgi:xanthine dehydrogenase accessory factor